MTGRTTPATAERAPLLALIRRVASATDSQVLRILATVETAADRREADILLSPLRPRLNVLRPPRRLRLRRLLFYPLDPLIVPPKVWRPGTPTIPRSALGPIATAIADAIPETIAAVEARIEGRTSADKDLLRIAGGMLWPAASRILDREREPPHWRDTGMAVAHYRTLAPVIATLLRQAPTIEALCQTSLPVLLPPPQETVQTVIRAVAADHAPALAWLFGVLMMRLPEPGVLFNRARSDPTERMVLQAREAATELLLSRLDADGPAAWIAGGDLTDAAAMLRRLMTLLTELDRTGRAERRAQCRSLRQRLDLAAQARFEASLRSGLLDMLGRSPLPDAAALEDAAYILRIFQSEARELGGKTRYDAGLAAAAASLSSADWPPEATRTTMVRLTEILLGTEAGLTQARM